MLRIIRPARILGRSLRAYSTEKDISYVNLANLEESPESAAAASQFFEFQTGRWLSNDRAERSKRTTKFNMKGLLKLLNEKVSVVQSGVAIDTLEPLFEGKHNKIYKIVLKDQRSYVLRIPYAIKDPKYIQYRLLSEAATLEFLGTQIFDDSSKYKVTRPIAYSGTSDNEIQSPFILSNFVNGKKLVYDWKPWSTDEKEKMTVIRPMVEMDGEILKYKFPAFGSLYFRGDLPSSVKQVPIGNGFVIGPSVEKRFWRLEKDNELHGPWQTWQEYLQATADIQVSLARANCGESSPNFKAAQRYLELVPNLFKAADIDQTEMISARLYDPDFSPMNIISQGNGEKFWLFDVENTVIKPYMLHGVPWFVRNRGERIFSLDDIPNYDSLPDQQKRMLQHMHQLTLNELTYEKLLQTVAPTLIQAHHPNIKRRESVVNRAMETDIDTGFYNDLDFAIYELMQLWPMINQITPGQASSEPPIKFSDKEVESLSESVAEWNQKVMQNKYLEYKGYLPASEFDELLGTGALVAKDEKIGNYEFTKEYFESQNLLKTF